MHRGSADYSAPQTTAITNYDQGTELRTFLVDRLHVHYIVYHAQQNRVMRKPECPFLMK